MNDTMRGNKSKGLRRFLTIIMRLHMRSQMRGRAVITGACGFLISRTE